MKEIDGSWTIFGCNEDDPKCIHKVDEAVKYIKEVGFLPFFSCDIQDFSLEERTIAKDWWGDDPAKDPWVWREVISRRDDIAYGKFFYNRAGFISKEWLPYFVNLRRDGYDFDARWDDEKASRREKKVMDVVCGIEILSNELKQQAGFQKGGEKGFEGVVTSLQMQTYLCVRDFRQRKNKKGEAYGWPITVYCTPEYIFGRDVVTKAYNEDPSKSGQRIAEHIRSIRPGATPQQITKFVR